MSDSVGVSIRDVQDSAAAHGGSCVVRFSQSLNPFKAFLGDEPETRNGVCRIMVLKWFIELAKAQPKFWSMLYDSDGSFNRAFVAQILMQTMSLGKVNVPKSTADNPHGADYDSLEDATFMDYMWANGFRKSLSAASKSYPDIFATLSSKLAMVYASAMKQTDYSFSLLICMKRTGGTHAIGFRIRGSDPILCLDPNLGEFSFPNIDGCCAWVEQDLKAMYARRYDQLMWCTLFKPC